MRGGHLGNGTTDHGMSPPTAWWAATGTGRHDVALNGTTWCSLWAATGSGGGHGHSSAPTACGQMADDGRDGAEQRQLRGEQPRLGQRRGGGRRGGHLGQRDRRASPARSRPPTAWWAAQTGDQVGYDGVTALSNGNYVVRSPHWDNGAVVDAGAVTWGNGTTGVTGAVSAANSLVGSTADDQVGIMA